jgi:hypothetical protein
VAPGWPVRGRSRPADCLAVVVTVNYTPWEYEIVVDGAVDADYSLRLPRWPNASSPRLAPRRPYPAGMATIEPSVRPSRFGTGWPR